MSCSVTFPDRMGGTDPNDEWSGAGRTAERRFAFVEFAVISTVPSGGTAGAPHAIRAHDAPCGETDGERRGVSQPSVNCGLEQLLHLAQQLVRETRFWQEHVTPGTLG